jgi:hypothetical protein
VHWYGALDLGTLQARYFDNLHLLVTEDVSRRGFVVDFGTASQERRESEM